ncbi:TPM domain-containing protein [Candidatus Electronema sp. TJ]|uniref:TPM domain-containing protein n=1 Tax=Candidatus Electronema sp. TJ TaxID=3401573 RepID=UPI003AA8D773
MLVMLPAMLRASTPPVPSSPPERVIDLANIIEPALEAQLVASLRELEEKTTAQMVILTVAALNGETIEAFSLHTFEQWKLGQKDKDNGLLLTVALKERKYRFETGYGLESVLPDSFLGSLGREKLVPFFKEGKYGEGVAAATKEVLAVLAKHYNVQLGSSIPLQLHRPKAPPARITSNYSKEWAWQFIFYFGVFLFFAAVAAVVILTIVEKLGMIAGKIAGKLGMTSGGYSNNRSHSSSSWSSSDSSSSWSSSDSSSSSSSDSGFSGGGGDSGGGGASGDW